LKHIWTLSTEEVIPLWNWIAER